MQENDDSVIFTPAERRSLGKLIASCSDAISRFSSDGDILGWNNYYALQMWDDKLNGNISDLSDYIDEGEDEEEENDEKGLQPFAIDATVDEDKYMKPTTVDEWLDAYGARDSEEDD